jgi:hypothetical protein
MCDKPQPTKTVKPDLCAENVPIDIRVSEAAPSSLPAYLARGRTVGAEFVDDNPTAELLFEEPLPEVAAPLAREISAGCILRSRYQLQQSIGQGGDSIVFRAQDLQLAATADSADSFVAIKILLPRQRTNVHALTRLRREFQQMQCLAHPGIVRVFNFECDGDVWFMTMELVAGQSVNSWMQTPSSPAQAVKIITVCCEALEHAHSAEQRFGGRRWHSEADRFWIGAQSRYPPYSRPRPERRGHAHLRQSASACGQQGGAAR